MTDPIADMLTRIRNAQAVRKDSVIIPFSKMKMNLADILVKEGFVTNVEKISENNKPLLKIKLKYFNKQLVLQNLKRISKPGRRVYVKTTEMPHVLNNLGVAIISTSSGLMTNKEAHAKKLGGELICELY